MKRILALILAAALALSFAACGSSESGGSGETLREGVTLQGLVEQLAQEYQMAAYMELSGGELATVLELDAGNIAEGYGLIATMNVSADHIIAIKAAEGKAQAVEDALKNRLKFEQDTFSQYLPGVYEKTLEGKVLTLGDYVFMFILGREDIGYSGEAASIEADIRAAFGA